MGHARTLNARNQRCKWITGLIEVEGLSVLEYLRQSFVHPLDEIELSSGIATYLTSLLSRIDRITMWTPCNATRHVQHVSSRELSLHRTLINARQRGTRRQKTGIYRSLLAHRYRYHRVRYRIHESKSIPISLRFANSYTVCEKYVLTRTWNVPFISRRELQVIERNRSYIFPRRKIFQYEIKFLHTRNFYSNTNLACL